jgi:hypothetical protein
MAAATTTTDPVSPATGAYRSPAAACSLAEVLDRILHLGVSLEGNLTISLANVDLLYLDLRLLLAAVDTVWPEGPPTGSAAPTWSQPPPSPPPPLPPSRDDRIRPNPAASVAPLTIAAGAVTPSAPPAAPSTAVAGLVRLVLTLVKVLHDVLERQAVRRMDGGHLTATQIDDVGAALLAQAVEIERLRTHFGLSDRDLGLKFGLSDRSI